MSSLFASRRETLYNLFLKINNSASHSKKIISTDILLGVLKYFNFVLVKDDTHLYINLYIG